jgi:hypothetical protein
VSGHFLAKVAKPFYMGIGAYSAVTLTHVINEASESFWECM